MNQKYEDDLYSWEASLATPSATLEAKPEKTEKWMKPWTLNEPKLPMASS